MLHNRTVIKLLCAHIIYRVQNHAENPVIIFRVYPVLATVTAQAFQMLIWESPESPYMNPPSSLQTTTEPSQGVAEQSTIRSAP